MPDLEVELTELQQASMRLADGKGHYAMLKLNAPDNAFGRELGFVGGARADPPQVPAAYLATRNRARNQRATSATCTNPTSRTPTLPRSSESRWARFASEPCVLRRPPGRGSSNNMNPGYPKWKGIVHDESVRMGDHRQRGSAAAGGFLVRRSGLRRL